MWNCVHSSVFRHVSWTAAIRSSSSFASEYLFFLVSHLQLKCKVWISGGEKQNNIRVTKLFAQKKTLYYREYFSPSVFNLRWFVSSTVVLSHFKASFRNLRWICCVFAAEYLYAVFKHKCCVCHWLFYYLITMSVHFNWWLSISAGSDKLKGFLTFQPFVAA